MIELGMYILKEENLSFEERLRATRAAGFDFICLGMGSLDQGKALSLCEQVGLPVDNVHLTGTKTNFIWEDGEIGREVTERYCREIALCSSLGIKTGIVHVTWGHHPPPADVSEIGLRCLDTIAEAAEKHNFVIALENSMFPPHLHAALERLQTPAIGYCFDSGHWNAFAKEEDFLGKYGNRLVATHLQDNNGVKDLHMIPLDGCVPFEQVAEGLARTELGRKRLTAEVKGTIVQECPGKSAAEIRKSLERIAILNDEDLVSIEDGRFSIYASLSYEEKLDRLIRALRKIAAMVEKA